MLHSRFPHLFGGRQPFGTRSSLPISCCYCLCAYFNNGIVHEQFCAERESGFLRNHRRSDCDTLCDEPPSSTSCRTIDSASCRDAGSAAAEFRTTPDQAASAAFFDRPNSRSVLGEAFEKRMLLPSGRTLKSRVIAHSSLQIANLQICHERFHVDHFTL